jgi:hypothetical protein
MHLDVAYPEHAFSDRFRNRQKEFTHTSDLRLASPGAGETYTAVFWGTLIVGGGLILLGSFILTFLTERFRRRTLPRFARAIE